MSDMFEVLVVLVMFILWVAFVCLMLGMAITLLVSPILLALHYLL